MKDFIQNIARIPKMLVGGILLLAGLVAVSVVVLIAQADEGSCDTLHGNA